MIEAYGQADLRKEEARRRTNDGKREMREGCTKGVPLVLGREKVYDKQHLTSQQQSDLHNCAL